MECYWTVNVILTDAERLIVGPSYLLIKECNKNSKSNIGSLIWDYMFAHACSVLVLANKELISHIIMLISIMIFASLTGNKTGLTDIWSKEYTPSGPTSNYLDRSKVQWSKWIGPRNTLTPKNIPILYLDLKKKTLNCIEMTLKLAQFCDDLKKISTKSSYPQKIFIFLKTQKNIEIQNFEPQKMDRAYVCVKISDYPPLPCADRQASM